MIYLFGNEKMPDYAFQAYLNMYIMFHQIEYDKDYKNSTAILIGSD